MNVFEQKVKQFINEQALFAGGERLLVALSGGADSVALLRVLLRLGYACEVAHCNFHLRGDESDRDEQFVVSLCNRLGVMLHTAHFETAAHAAREGISIEMAARELRYAFFNRLLAERGLQAVAVAHHRDDSVETLLLNLVRGTGLRGLRGIPARNGVVVRPLLSVGRREVLDYLGSLGQAYVTDSTNLHDDYLRNKIRLNVLPLLEEVNPAARLNIARAADHLREVGMVYDRTTTDALARVKLTGGGGLSIPALLQEEAPRLLLYEWLYPLGFTVSQVDDVYAALGAEAGRRFHAPKWELLKDRDELLLRRCREGQEQTPMELTVSEADVVGCSLELGEEGQLVFSRQVYSKDFVIPRDRETACIDVDTVDFPLTVRRSRTGDRFMPFGMKGMKSVADYLTDRKRSLFDKERQWVVCDARGRIVWLVGERSDERFRVTSSTRETLVLRRM